MRLYIWLVLTWPMAFISAWTLMLAAHRAEACDAAGLADRARRWVLLAHSAVDGDWMRIFLACKLRVLRRQGRRKKAREIVANHQAFVIDLASIAQRLG